MMPDIAVNDTNINSEAIAREPRTVGQSLDSRIKHARQQVEQLCIAKAKAEALGILDYPQEFVEQLAYGPF
jgi:hypothetical protein